MTAAATRDWRRTILPVLLLGGLAIASWFVIAPFIAALVWAVMIAYATWPLFIRLRKMLGGRNVIASLTMTLICAVVLFAPLVWGLWAAQSEAGELVRGARVFLADPPSVPSWIRNLPAIGTWLDELRTGWVHRPEAMSAEIAEWFKTHTDEMTALAGQIGKNLGKMMIALTALFFVYRDGERLSAQVRHVLAKAIGSRADGYVDEVGATTRAVVYGLLITALIQGALAGIGYAVAGVSAPILLGFVTAVLALVPFATVLAWGSAGLWLLVQGDTVAGIGILLWGALVVSQIDNVIRPLVISANTDIPFMLVLVGVLGGALAFGLIGLFVGPILLAVLLAVWREWTEGLDLDTESPAEPAKTG